jgi:hypothetical protein
LPLDGPVDQEFRGARDALTASLDLVLEALNLFTGVFVIGRLARLPCALEAILHTRIFNDAVQYRSKLVEDQALDAPLVDRLSAPCTAIVASTAITQSIR